jgi:hypothetical protein
MTISIEKLKEFFSEYISRYHDEYDRFIAVPPTGPGYPKVDISPYLKKSTFDFYLAKNGVIVNQLNVEPDYEWYIAGGPAIKVDYEPTVTPKEGTQKLKSVGLLGQKIGIYRVVAKKPLANKVWRGRIDGVIRSFMYENLGNGIIANFYYVSHTLKELINILTFGAFGTILDTPVPSDEDNFGEPHIIRDLGVFPADLNNKRFFKYMEIYGHIDDSAWDKRLVKLRVKSDLRRDFTYALSLQKTSKTPGTLFFGSTPDWAENFTNRLTSLKKAIDAFREILLFKSDETEDVFHNLLQSYPILLEVYGTCESKPRFYYPDGHKSIIGKKYLEPDFLVTYPDQSYKLIELERASKIIATKQGQPRAEMTQAAFQIAEWRHYIKSHYSSIKDRYPGIQSKCKSLIIISRRSQKMFGGIEDQKQYVELIMEEYRVDEVLTYDDLFERACFAYYQLTGLNPSII